MKLDFNLCLMAFLHRGDERFLVYRPDILLRTPSVLPVLPSRSSDAGSVLSARLSACF
jgi:hypothetical protein